jgi:hypothetical protein
MAKHKWYNEIVAWASGAEIEFLSAGEWLYVDIPEWNEETQYRVKPQRVKPQYLYAYERIDNGNIQFSPRLQLHGSAFEYIGKIPLIEDEK